MRALATSTRTAPPDDAHDRGDVPGWVLVTMMTAGLVAALWAVAGPTLSKLFTDAVSGVSP